jgi:hypothetical protein
VEPVFFDWRSYHAINNKMGKLVALDEWIRQMMAVHIAEGTMTLS